MESQEKDICGRKNKMRTVFTVLIFDELLSEVTGQQFGESLSVAGFIAGHFIKTCATLGFAYNFLQLFYNFAAFPCNSLTPLYNFEELFERFHSNA